MTNPEMAELLKRCLSVIGLLDCEECGHSLILHNEDGCEYERGDHPGGEGDLGPYAAYALGPCGCVAPRRFVLSEDGQDQWKLLCDLKDAL